MSRQPCQWCGSDAAEGTCPKSLACPRGTCAAAPGQRCRRPSGHPADELHAERIAAAERPAMPAPRDWETPAQRAAVTRDARARLAEERPAMPAPLDAQLDLDGGRHDIAPATERMRLFDPAPAQIAGQTHLELDEPNGKD